MPETASQRLCRAFSQPFTAVVALAVSLGGTQRVSAQDAAAQELRSVGEQRYALILNTLEVRSGLLAEITDTEILYLAEDGWKSIPTRECLAIVAESRAADEPLKGFASLADGQVLPGDIDTSTMTPPETLRWTHPWLGSLQIPLQEVRAVVLDPSVAAPTPKQSDIVQLTNGDRLEGFILAVGDPIALEVEQTVNDSLEIQTVTLPLERVAALSMITPAQEGEDRRIWLTDGTVLDVQEFALSEDGRVRLRTAWSASSEFAESVRLRSVVAVLFERGRLTPLAQLQPVEVSGPPTRYVVPAPILTQPNAALDLSPVQMQGPLVVRYRLPDGASRFAARATLPPGAERYGDFELIVRDADRELLRERLNAKSPVLDISVPLDSRELTIELVEGANGPIQDTLLLERPMVLVE